jgi:hypothetical protein
MKHKITNPHHFGLGVGHLPRKANTIARQHDAELVNYTEPDGRKRHWFNCQNMGEPFDSRIAHEVISDLRDVGLLER